MTNSYPAHQVSVRASWSDSWTPVSYLFCDSLTSVCNPDISQANLWYQYGIGQRFDRSTFDTYSRQDLTGNYVRIEVSGLGAWYGTIVEKMDEHAGAHFVSGARVPKGRENYIAYGLEFLLDRSVIRESVVRTSATAEQTIGRAIAFNSGRGWSDQGGAIAGNASTTVGSKNTRIFAQFLNERASQKWTAKDIIRYLLAYFPPRDKDGNADLNYVLDASSQVGALEFAVPTLDVDGMTVKEVLDQLITRQRGLGWKLSINESLSEVQVQVFTFADSDIALPSGLTFPANSDQVSLDYDLNEQTRSAMLRESEAVQYEQVIARGARRGAVCTLSYTDSNLEADWTAALETAYETAASGASDYSSLTDAQKQARNNDARAADTYRAVWSWYKVPDTWDAKAGDGIGGTKSFIFPQLDSSGVPIGFAEPHWNSGLRFEQYLPLLKHHDYSGGNIDAGTVSDDSPDNSTPEWLEPFVLFRIETGTPNRYQFSEHLAIAADSGDTNRAQSWSANLAMRDDAAGLELRVIGGHQHYLGETDFNALAADDFSADQYVDWQEMLATVYILSDTHVEESYPADASVADTDVERELIISVPDAHLDYVPNGTVVGISDGELQAVTTAAFVRDDRDRLRDIARAAWQWYGTTRKVLSYAERGVLGSYKVGQLVTTIGSGATQQTVNTVITGVSYDLREAVTSLQTQFANLDAGLFV